MEEFICINGKAEKDIKEKYLKIEKVFCLPYIGENCIFTYTYCGKYSLVPLARYKDNYVSAYDDKYSISELKEIYEDFKSYVAEYEKFPENLINKEYLAKSKAVLPELPDYIHTQELAYEIYLSENKAKTCFDMLLRNYFDLQTNYHRCYTLINDIFKKQKIHGVADFYNVHVKFNPFDRYSSKFYLMLMRKAYSLAEQNKLDTNLACKFIDCLLETVGLPKIYTKSLSKEEIKTIMKTKL